LADGREDFVAAEHRERRLRAGCGWRLVPPGGGLTRRTGLVGHCPREANAKAEWPTNNRKPRRPAPGGAAGEATGGGTPTEAGSAGWDAIGGGARAVRPVEPPVAARRARRAVQAGVPAAAGAHARCLPLAGEEAPRAPRVQRTTEARAVRAGAGGASGDAGSEDVGAPGAAGALGKEEPGCGGPARPRAQCARACCGSVISSMTLFTNAGMSAGLRLVTQPLSTTTSRSTHVAPAFSRSFRSEGHDVIVLPRT